MTSVASDLARQLARNAEAVCRHYLSEGRREGRYWIIGDVHGSPGRSLYVRLTGGDHGKGAAGKWTDAATGEHGDLLDLIGLNQGHDRLADSLDEARRFLSLPRPSPVTTMPDLPAPRGSPGASRRLFAGSKPIRGTIAEHYLRGRHIFAAGHCTALRFHPRCWYTPSEDDALGINDAYPAMIAAVTNLSGTITGVHRTWLEPDGCGKAPVACPRRAMGHLLGHGVRLGPAAPVMVAGEGIETILSLREAAPTLPMIAGLSGAHLAAIAFPPMLRRLYVARDNDPAGSQALATLAERAEAAGIALVPLEPRFDDFNTDLMRRGLDCLCRDVSGQLHVQDRERFLHTAA